MLTINMLGKGAIFHDNECISEKLSSKLVALVCLLVLNRNRNMSKEKVVSYLWPDSDDEAAKSNLRFNLWTIRKTVPQSPDGEDFIVSGKDHCRINEKYQYSCDKTLLDSVKVSQIDNIEELLGLKDLFRGDFLEGLYLRNCSEFNEMILFERVVCQNKQVEILEKLIGLYEAQERYEEELRILNEVAAIEPYNEDFAYRAIRIYKLTGNRTAAINYYKNFEIVLRRNLDTSPNNELKLLYRELMESSCGARPEHKDGGNHAKKRIEAKVCGLKDVEYYGIAGIIDQIARSADRKYILELDPPLLADLRHIYSGLIPINESSRPDPDGNGRCVPSVRIALAFLKLIEHVSRRYDIDIRIADFADMDPFSQNLVHHIQKAYQNIKVQQV
jgi:DNA-binding SARP family transcriptional activator